jgi:PST family polysaccharide transporter
LYRNTEYHGLEDTTLSRDDIEIAATTARGTVITLVGNILAVVFGAIGVLVTARVLSPEEYGLYTVAMLPVTILNLVAGVGIDQAVPRFLVLSRTQPETAKPHHLVYASLLVKLGTGTSLALLQYLTADSLALLLNRPLLTPYIRIAALAS